MKNLTVNEMIWNTMRTRADRKPKYFDILTACGYSVALFDEKYWSVDSLHIEQYDKLILWIGYAPVYSVRHGINNIKKVDFQNLLATDRVARNAAWNRYDCKYVDVRYYRKGYNGRRIHDYRYANSTIDEYKRLKANAESTWHIDFHEDEIERLRDKVRQLMNEIEYHEGKVAVETEKHAEDQRKFEIFKSEHGIA